MKSLRRFLLLLACILVGGLPALAHDPGLSVATASHRNGTLIIHLAIARSDLERLAGEPKQTKEQLRDVARDAFLVTSAGSKLACEEPRVTLGAANGVDLTFGFTGLAQSNLSIQSVILERLPRGHRQFFSMRGQDQKPVAQSMLDAEHSVFTVGIGEQPAAPERKSSFTGYLRLGVEHIATGYDHLLFLFGLLLVGGSLRSALKIITSFTLAHSITLVLATLNIINIPSRIIEPLIAASIVFVGVQNILAPDAGKRWLLTFGFGLIHGCGFASALRELGVGVDGQGIAVPLLSFNLGVELGQVVIAAIVLPCIWKSQQSPIFLKRLVPAGSAIIVMAGGYWLLARTVL
jgi:hydrogenase/urease accessory protein HupE